MLVLAKSVVLVGGLMSLVSLVGGVLTLAAWTEGDNFRGYSSGECVRPGGGRGICRKLKDCKPLFNFLVQKKSRPEPWAIEFLKMSHCGFERNDPIVCCPVSERNKELPENVREEEKSWNSSCGSIEVLDKIFGGSPAVAEEFPWMALIGYSTRNGLEFRCGGSLISPRYVLTAAHCVSNLKDIWPSCVRLGVHDLKRRKKCDFGRGRSGAGQDVGIEGLIPHPGYLKAELRNDIALIRLSAQVNYVNSIKPVCLPTESNIAERLFHSEKAVVAGWGTTDSGTASQVLRKVTLPLVPKEECSKIYKKMIPITNTQICAGGEPGRDSCTGDSGGPLHIVALGPSGRPAYVQHGIVSFGPRHCGTKGIPGVYTKVSHFLPWILAIIRQR